MRSTKYRVVQRCMHQPSMSNDELLSMLKATWREEVGLMARVISMLIDVEERRLHLELACPSIFLFCVRQLGMSESEAYRRATAARLAKRHPQILEALRNNRIHLSALLELRDLITAENVDSLLAAA